MPPRKKLFPAILYASLIAGLLDGVAAIIQFTVNGGKDPSRVFRFIASGVFGKNAFTGGSIMVLWGTLFHFLIAFLFTLFYFLVYPKISRIGGYKITAGILYGIFVWAVMNLVVVPLSSTPSLPFQPLKALVAVLILVLCIGLPVSLLANKYYLYKK